MRIAFVMALLVAAVVSSAASAKPRLSLVPADIAEPPFEVAGADAPSNFQLLLVREYGRALFTRCRLSVVVFQKHGSGELRCDLNTRGPAGDVLPPLHAREELSPQETLRMINLFEPAALYERGHIGTDSTSVDGIFETLKVTSESGTVVLVTSGNTTFEIDAARKELLAQLRSLEKRLAGRGR